MMPMASLRSYLGTSAAAGTGLEGWGGGLEDIALGGSLTKVIKSGLFSVYLEAYGVDVTAVDR